MLHTVHNKFNNPVRKNGCDLIHSTQTTRVHVHTHKTCRIQLIHKHKQKRR